MNREKWAANFESLRRQLRGLWPGGQLGRLALLFGLTFIILSAATATHAGTINGTLFIENNPDGIRQPNEGGAGGPTINVFNAGPDLQIGGGDDFLAGSDITNGQGHFSVTSLPAGVYYIQAVLNVPTGFIFSPQDQGSDDSLDSDVDPNNGISAVFALGAASTVTRDIGTIGCRLSNASGANPAAIQSVIDTFRDNFGGGIVPGPNGSFGGLRREITWDSVPATSAAPNNLPANFFNVNSPRGVVFSTPGTSLQVSGAAADNGAGQPAAARFGNIQASYTNNFQTFSSERLFTARGSNVVDVTFFLPGTNTPAFTNGFGAVFTDVETAGATTIEYFNQTGASLGKKAVPVAPNGGLSFVGLNFTNSRLQIISRVRITCGNANLGAVEGGSDLVVMDDFIYGEPVPNTNLVVTESDSPDPVAAGTNLTYNITFTNTGTADLHNVTLSDNIANYTFVSMVQNTGPAFVLNTLPQGGTGQITGSLDTLPGGATATFTLVVKIASDIAFTQVANQVIGATSPTDTIPNDNFDSTVTDVSKQVDLSVIKTGSPTTPPGGNIVYNIAINNAGPSDAQPVTLSDSLPPDTTFVSFTQTSGPTFILNKPPVDTNGVVSAVRPVFAVGASASFTLVARVAPATPLNTVIANTATFSSPILETNPLDNLSQALTTVVPPTLSINDVVIAEGNAGSTNMVFTVSLNAPSTNLVSLSYVSSNGTAVSPGDYQSVVDTLTFTPGQTSRDIVVPVNGDTSAEGNETFFVNLANPTNATITDAQGLGTINDDDASGIFQFSVASMNVSEAAGSATVTITRTGDTSGTASVHFETSDQTAQQKKDYTFESGTVQFAPNETSKDVNIPVVNDVYLENNETFQVDLSNPSGNYAVGSPNQIVVTILSDDPGGASNPIDDAGFFVRQQYLDFLGRDADTAGLTFWTNNITACGGDVNCRAAKRVDTSAAFFLSIEFQETSGNVLRTQRVAFGRQSNDSVLRVPYLQFMRDSRQVGQGVIFGQPGADALLESNKQAYAQQIIDSAIFLARFPVAPGGPYVDALFASAGVTPTAAERTAAINAFGAGGTTGRVAALRSVSDSASVRQAELSPSFVLSQYYGYLRRNPTDAPDFNDAGYQFWLNKLNSFSGDFRAADMVKAFITAGEYRQRFGQ